MLFFSIIWHFKFFFPFLIIGCLNICVCELKPASSSRTNNGRCVVPLSKEQHCWRDVQMKKDLANVTKQVQVLTQLLNTSQHVERTPGSKRIREVEVEASWHGGSSRCSRCRWVHRNITSLLQNIIPFDAIRDILVWRF